MRCGWLHFAIQVDHGVPCWLVTWLLMQLFVPRRLGGLDDADALWLYGVVKRLHNSDLNARAMSEVGHLKPILPLALLLQVHLACDGS